MLGSNLWTALAPRGQTFIVFFNSDPLERLFRLFLGVFLCERSTRGEGGAWKSKAWKGKVPCKSNNIRALSKLKGGTFAKALQSNTIQHPKKRIRTNGTPKKEPVLDRLDTLKRALETVLVHIVINPSARRDELGGMKRVKGSIKLLKF